MCFLCEFEVMWMYVNVLVLCFIHGLCVHNISSFQNMHIYDFRFVDESLRMLLMLLLTLGRAED